MKAIILAAGLGTRLRPYTSDRPKCLVEIEGISLLDRQLAVLRSRGITDVVIVGGHHSRMLHKKASKIRVNNRYDETNMVWSLFCAEDQLDGEVIVSYGDIVYSGEILDRLLLSPADIAVAIDMEWEAYWRLRSDHPLADAESLRLGEKNQILEIGQSANSLAEIEGQYMGVMKLTPRGADQLKRGFREATHSRGLGIKSLESWAMTDLLQDLIHGGHIVTAVENREPWVEIDTVRDLLSDVSSRRVRKISQLL